MFVTIRRYATDPQEKALYHKELGKQKLFFQTNKKKLLIIINFMNIRYCKILNKFV